MTCMLGIRYVTISGLPGGFPQKVRGGACELKPKFAAVASPVHLSLGVTAFSIALTGFRRRQCQNLKLWERSVLKKEETEARGVK